MKRINKKASAMGGEAVIITAIVIIVLILGGMFLFRANLAARMKNLPGFTGPGAEDRVIEGVDEPFIFDCKYPIGYVDPQQRGKKTIHLLPLDEVKETGFESIRDQTAKASEKPYLKIDSEKIIYEEGRRLKTEIATIKQDTQLDRSRGHWGTIEIKNDMNSFIFNDWDIRLQGITSIPENLKDLKKNLKLLYNARYHPSTGLICGNPKIIESLKEAEKCVESCKIHGGECKKEGGGEADLGKIDCEDGEKCFRPQHSFDPDRHLGALIVNQIPEADQITTNTNWEFIINKPYAFSIKLMQGNQKNNFCYSIRTKTQNIKNYSFQGTYPQLEAIEFFSFNNLDEEQIIFSAWNPSLNKATIKIFTISIIENPQIEIDLRQETEERIEKRTINTFFRSEEVVKINLEDYFEPHSPFPRRNPEFYFKLEKEENKINIKRNSGNPFGFVNPDGFLWLEKSQFKTPMKTMKSLNSNLKFYTMEEETIGRITPKVYSKTNMVLNYSEMLKYL
jgi:hypothetical protein